MSLIIQYNYVYVTHRGLYNVIIYSNVAFAGCALLYYVHSHNNIITHVDQCTIIDDIGDFVD